MGPEEFTSGIAVENYLRRLFSPNSRDPTAKQFLKEFKAIDSNGNLKVDFEETFAFLQKKMGYHLQRTQVRSLFDRFDMDKNNDLNYLEFRVLWASLLHFNIIILE